MYRALLRVSSALHVDGDSILPLRGQLPLLTPGLCPIGRPFIFSPALAQALATSYRDRDARRLPSFFPVICAEFACGYKINTNSTGHTPRKSRGIPSMFARPLAASLDSPMAPFLPVQGPPVSSRLSRCLVAPGERTLRTAWLSIHAGQRGNHHLDSQGATTCMEPLEIAAVQLSGTTYEDRFLYEGLVIRWGIGAQMSRLCGTTGTTSDLPIPPWPYLGLGCFVSMPGMTRFDAWGFELL
ncbi:hypothetical protein J3F83DRAFT_419398 [Trichoderma novae-zelandiae]